jgi:Mrp family chromosome partitioning ATPase
VTLDIDTPAPVAASSPVALAGQHGTGASAPPVHAAPARIDYTTTQVLPAARMALLSTMGVVKSDRSELAETFKMLRGQVLQRMRADGHRVLAVTSPRRIAGKSLTALNLALAIAADFDSTALLIDADLGGEGLQRLFGLGGAPGLGDHLVRGVPISGLLVNPQIERFVFLPATSMPVAQSAELLATRVARELVEQMKARYPDRILVVDLPAALSTADALAFLPLADTTLVVIEEHSTTMSDMEALADLLAPFELVGTVISRRLD